MPCWTPAISHHSHHDAQVGKTINRPPYNYRPLSLLEVQEKIFKRIINYILRCHFKENNLYNPSQYGIKAGKSTTSDIRLFRKGTHLLTALFKITWFWKISKDFLMSLEVSILLQSPFASKFLSFTKSARGKSGIFSLLLFNALFLIFTLNEIRRWWLVLNSTITFRWVTKSLQVDRTRSMILLSFVGLLICWCNSLSKIIL